MKRSNKTKSTLETLLVIGLILIIPLFFAINSGANAPETQAEISPIPPTVTPTVSSTAVSTSTPQEPPACTFPLDGTTTEESTPQEYIFSEPRVVLSAPKGNSYEIVSWLPDNKQVLIVEDLYGNYVQNNSNSPQQSINLYDTEKNEIKVYAIHQGVGNTPSWSSAIDAVVYPVMHYYDIDRKNQTYKFTHQIWVSYDNPDNMQLLKEDLSQQILVTVKPDGSQFVYSENNGEFLARLYTRSVSHGAVGAEQLLPFDVPQVKYASQSMNYTMTWRPNTSHLFFYSGYSLTNQTIILDINSGKSCALRFDGWVYFARWSPNGRYLAVITTHSPKGPIWVNYDLSVLDTLTGDLHKMDSNQIEPPHLAHVVGDLSWAPDNHHLAIIGDAYAASTSPPPTIYRLYLVDFLSGEVDNLFPSYQVYAGRWGENLAWSPDGTKILVNCPTEKQGRLCLIPVQVGGQ